MERRSSIQLLALGGIALATTGGYHWLNKRRDHPQLAIDLTLERLDKLKVAQLQGSGSWEVARTFNHLAQSIEFSMTGFPEIKSPVFQNTVGQLAFSLFHARGKMSHNLAEAIPGETIQAVDVDSKASLQRLMQALQRFESFENPLQPHFAYGGLSKDEYAIAHVMHINNHLEEFAVG